MTNIKQYIKDHDLKSITKRKFNRYVLSNNYTLRDFYDNEYVPRTLFYRDNDFSESNTLDSLYEIIDVSDCKDQKAKYNKVLEFALCTDEMYVEAIDNDKMLVQYSWH